MAAATQPANATGPAHVRSAPATASSGASSVASDDDNIDFYRSVNVSAAEVTSLLDEIGSVTCSESTKATMSTIFASNAVLLDTCLKESGYLLFPYAGYLPRQGMISKVCASPSCMDLLSGIVLAKLPECTNDNYNPRALSDAFFRVRVDLANGRSPPSSDAFRELYQLTRVVNMLNDNATLNARVGGSFPLENVRESMNPVEINPDVVLGENYVIYVQASSASGSAAKTPSVSKGKGKSSDSGSSSASVGTSPPEASAVTGSGKTAASKLSISYFVIGFAWMVFNLSYFVLMSWKD
ncbi:Elicitin, partial [Globisporangium splendens]